MEKITLCFTIISVIYMALTYLRLGDIDHNATVNTNLIRRDIVDHDSHISTAVSVCALQVSDMEKSLTTEIACLATKNNEDIKRMKGDYAVGDILRFGGTRWRVFGKDTLDDGRTRWKLFGENGEEYRIYTDDMPRDLEFLGHRELFD